MDDKPSLKGAWLSHVTHFKILGAPSISEEWLKLELSNFVQWETILSLAKGMRNHPYKGRDFGHMTHFCMHSCGVRKKSPLHSVICDKQWPRQRTTDYHTFDCQR